MKCPVCHYRDSKVIDSRLATDGFAIRRRRECHKCTFRFSTYEEVELLNLTVLKRDGRREAYLQDKLKSGLIKAFEKRPITTEELTRLISRIERDIQRKGGKKSSQEVKTSEIGEIIMRHLKRVDPVAYIRFASVYRSFKDAETFQKELKALVKPPKSKKTSLTNTGRRNNN